MTDRFSSSMHHKVSYRHLASRDEGCQTRQQTHCNHQPADEFNDPADEHQTLRTVPATRESQKFLSTVTGEHKTNYQSHNAVNRVRKTIERVHSRSG